VTPKASSRELLTFLRLQRLPGGRTQNPSDLPSPSFPGELRASFIPSCVGPVPTAPPLLRSLATATGRDGRCWPPHPCRRDGRIPSRRPFYLRTPATGKEDATMDVDLQHPACPLLRVATSVPSWSSQISGWCRCLLPSRRAGAASDLGVHRRA
jgi:hypothetical protein